MAVRQSRMVRENTDFSTLIGCHDKFPWKIEKLNEVNKPLQPSTNTEILVKVGPLGSELQGLESRPLKK